MPFTGSKKSWLKKSRLYLVLDADVSSHEKMLRFAPVVVSAGVDVIQIRDKRGEARALVSLAREMIKRLKGRAPLIINDRIDVAWACGADGVHLGQDDLDPAVARKILGVKAIIGRSCQTLDHLRRAVKDGVDYVGFGSVFTTKTKPDRLPMDPDLLRRAACTSSVPLFAIGGIDENRLLQLRAIGVQRVAVTRAVSSANDAAGAVRRLKRMLT